MAATSSVVSSLKAAKAISGKHRGRKTSSSSAAAAAVHSDPQQAVVVTAVAEDDTSGKQMAAADNHSKLAGDSKPKSNVTFDAIVKSATAEGIYVFDPPRVRRQHDTCAPPRDEY